MCITCRQLDEKSGLLILLILISNNFPFVGLPHTILLQMLASGTYLSASAVTHRPRTIDWISICHFPVLQQVSVSLRIVEDMMMTHWNPHGEKRLFSDRQHRLCIEMKYRWAGTLKAWRDVMLSAHLWPKAWLKGSNNTAPWPDVGDWFSSALSSRQLVSAECWQRIT